MPRFQEQTNVYTLATTVVLLATSGLSGSAWQITQLTNNSYDDQSPKISGSNIVWKARGNIFLYDGTTTKQLTHDGLNGFSQVSGSSVVWSKSGPGGAREIFFHKGGVTQQITNSGTMNIWPQVSGEKITWLGQDQSGNYGVYFYDGSTIDLLYPSATQATRPKISGNNVVWVGYDGNDSEIYRYDGQQITAITDNNYPDVSPVVEGDRIAWVARAAPWRIGIFDGQSTKEVGLQTGIYAPALSGVRVSWDGNDSSLVNDEEIYFYDGVTVAQLTDNDDRDFATDVSETHVVWYQGVLNEAEVFVYDGKEITQLTDNSFPDVFPQVDGSAVVWWGSDGHDEEVFIARPIPEPTALVTWLLLIAVVATSMSYRTLGATL